MDITNEPLSDFSTSNVASDLIWLADESDKRCLEECSRW